MLRHVVPAVYEYRWISAMKYLKLQESDFAPEFNVDYREEKYPEEDRRGGYPYYLPLGWFRHGLRVLDKYEEGPTWIGQVNGEGEWAVAYHGTGAEVADGIVEEGLLSSAVRRDVMRKEAVKEFGEEADRPAVYVATNCDGGAAIFTTPFTVTSFPDQSETFCLVFQCRVKPEKFSVHDTPVEQGKAWRFVHATSIRPYGLLLKKCDILQE